MKRHWIVINFFTKNYHHLSEIILYQGYIWSIRTVFALHNNNNNNMKYEKRSILKIIFEEMFKEVFD